MCRLPDCNSPFGHCRVKSVLQAGQKYFSKSKLSFYMNTIQTLLLFTDLKALYANALL